MSELSAKAKRQILLLGSDLIMKIKSSSYKNKEQIINDLEKRLQYLKSRAIVPANYTFDNLTRDAGICTNVSDVYKRTKRS